MGVQGRTHRPLRQRPLWVRVDENRIRLAVFVLAFVLGSALLLTAALVGVPGGLFGVVWTADLSPDTADAYWSDLVTALLVAMGVLLGIGALVTAVQLSNAEDWVRNRFKGRALRPGEQPGLERAVSDMAIAGGLSGMPALVVLETNAVNAYALGTARSHATIGVTQGFLDAVPVDEQRAVIATLVARIVSGDILFATALAALMGPITLIRLSPKAAASGAEGCLDSGCSSGCSGPGDAGDGCSGCLAGDLDTESAGGCLGIGGMALAIVVIAVITYVAVVSAAWIVTIWGRALHSTTYEKADAEGMLLLKEPAPMLAALQRCVTSDTRIADGDRSYDGIFYASTSGLPALDRTELRRMRRLAEVVGVDGMVHVAGADAP